MKLVCSSLFSARSPPPQDRIIVQVRLLRIPYLCINKETRNFKSMETLVLMNITQQEQLQVDVYGQEKAHLANLIDSKGVTAYRMSGLDGYVIPVSELKFSFKQLKNNLEVYKDHQRGIKVVRIADLVDYLFSLAHQSYLSGIPMMQALNLTLSSAFR